MPTNGQDESAAAHTESPDNSPPLRVRRRPDPLLVVFRCFSFVAALAAVLCVAVNGLSVYFSFRHAHDIFGGIFRCYAAVIALFAAAVETEWSWLLKYWTIFEYWVARGMLQIFIAVMTKAFPDVYHQRTELIMLQEIASYLLMACGVIYVISGLLCVGCLKRSRMRQETSREQATKDLKELEKRRQELEALLVPERV